MAFFHHNSSTLVPLLGTPFNTISCFSDQMVYLPNAPWHSRRIHQRDWSSPRSPSSTIQPGQTVLPVPGPSIVPTDNDSNWEDIPTNPITNTTTANRPTSSTCSWSKPCQSENPNEQLADLLTHLILIRLLVPILIQEKLKPISLTSSVTLSLISSIISCSNVIYIFVLIWCNSTWTLWKSTLQWLILLE